MTRDLDRRYRRACEQNLTYAQTGATLGPSLPAGFAHLRRKVRLGEGREVFEQAGAYVLAWGVQRGAGFDVHPVSPPAPGGTALVTTRLPGLRYPRLVVPCRVVWTVAEARRVGFAYGTLPGHPESGEESFVVTYDERGDVWFEVSAFSRPATWYARLSSPVTRLMQHAAATRYLRAVTASVAGRATPR
ncbi:DUF1990 domain-containing protein [Streptomyces sp. NPDC004647]|uniref:DUF1990 family protein n=1 Tax=Streptomyces sp. NPDC004647 TaxID=3154671 RepID=UPI0033B537AD